LVYKIAGAEIDASPFDLETSTTFVPGTIVLDGVSPWLCYQDTGEKYFVNLSTGQLLERQYYHHQIGFTYFKDWQLIAVKPQSREPIFSLSSGILSK
jgi:hypothetical protein